MSICGGKGKSPIIAFCASEHQDQTAPPGLFSFGIPRVINSAIKSLGCIWQFYMHLHLAPSTEIQNFTVLILQLQFKKNAVSTVIG